MARLKDMLGFVKNRDEVLEAVEVRLQELQIRYEAHYQRVKAVRESELSQLEEHILQDRESLPPALREALDAAEKAAAAELDAQLAKLEEKKSHLEGRMEKVRNASLDDEGKVVARNTDLDDEEEALKARSTQLLARIEQYNDRIRELGGGFGFFWNFFRMRSLAKERRLIDDEQADVAARIDQLRRQWVERESEFATDEETRQSAWVDLRTRASALQAKIDLLRESRPAVLRRTTLERVLFEKVRELPEPADGDPACPTCHAPNARGSHFCRICAERLGEDRTDLEGSMEEIAEVNLHHARFAEGMKACQEIIGLVRGLRSGHSAFSESVESMIENEDRYPLPKLNVNVPEESIAYGRHFEAFQRAVGEDLRLHPRVLARRVQEATEGVFTEEKVKGYFEAMGEELSRQAGSQWG